MEKKNVKTNKAEQTDGLKKRWLKICNEYAKLFADKHEFDIEYDLEHNYLWVGDDPGTVAQMGDQFIGMDEIRYDIDNNIPEEKFDQWYWKNLDRYEHNLPFMNYPSYCMGAPDPLSKKQEEKINEARMKMDEARALFDAEMDKLAKKPH